MKSRRKYLRAYHTPGLVEAGCDEAGRGCLAGPVVAAAVILPPDFRCSGLNDSKLIPEEERNRLRRVIEKKALFWAVGVATHTEIDEINILNASFLAMHRALDQLETTPDSILVDGHMFHPYREIQHHCIIRGDSKMYAIAAASILAKTHRDEMMKKLHLEHPLYQWEQNKGYSTAHHRSAITTHGLTQYHRRSFGICSNAGATAEVEMLAETFSR